MPIASLLNLSLAPDTMFYQVALYMRGYWRADISDAQFRDLGDAIHNLPAALIEYGHDFDEAAMREIYFKSYDEKWATTENSFSLVRTLDAGIKLKLKSMPKQ